MSLSDRLSRGRIGRARFVARRLAHTGRRPRLRGIDRAWADELSSAGAFTTDLDELDLPITAEFRRAVDRILPTLPDRAAHADRPGLHGLDPLLGRNTALHCCSVDAADLVADHPALVRFGLEERLLDIAERHLGVPVAFTALHLRKDIGGGNQVGTRYWHLDTEDFRVVRMMVYLSDVTIDDGPFEYIPRPMTEAVPELRERALRSAGVPIFDAEMRSHVPESEWRPVIGAAGTVLLADNALCYHHGRVHDSERTVLIYTYTSRHPQYPRLTRNTALDEALTARQRAAMFLETAG